MCAAGHPISDAGASLGRGLVAYSRGGPTLDGPLGTAVDALTDRVRERFGAATTAVLFYGSVLRDQADLDDCVLDLTVVVDGYRKAFGNWGLAATNALLPPNVFYLEVDVAGQRVRCKYAVISVGQLRGHTAPRCLQTYYWGRLSQPTALVFARDEAAVTTIDEIISQAAATFASATIPLISAPFDAAMLWRRGLQASYRTEFRPERRDRAKTLTTLNLARYETACRSLAAELEWSTDEEGRYVVPTSAMRRGWCRFAWLVRVLQGRTLHVLRLMKAAFTFDGGAEYLAWKIERHSGVKVEMSERTRRHPLIFGWWTLWRLRRKGGFR